MERLICRPQELDFDSPGRRDYWVALEHDSIWGDHLIPLTVMVGQQARPEAEDEKRSEEDYERYLAPESGVLHIVPFF